MKLLIVESPSKAKKIAGYLGGDWQVEASYGHIRDLPKKGIGVEPPSYLPDYEVGERSKKTVSRLRQLAKQANEIYLAPDPDREGEAIAWHLAELLCKHKPYKRVTFNEITQSAIKAALEIPRQVDEDLFYAQQGRRVLDRLYGYKLSPALSQKMNQFGVSAGRVQSVALRMIVDREKAIRHFVKVAHYGVSLTFETQETLWKARWDTSDFVNDELPYITDKDIALRVKLATEQKGVVISDFLETEKKRKPPAPLITSTLQQAAANKLRLTVTETMAAAQKLFEDGLITYHRTDNPNLSEEAVDMLWAFLRNAGQSEHIPDKPHKWKTKADAQEAHEAIRPTDFTRRAANTGNEQYDKLYLLIWRATVASQMREAVYKVRNVVLQSLADIDFSGTVNSTVQKASFKASGSEVIYQGWLMLMNDDYTSEDSTESHLLPLLTLGDELMPLSTNLLALETKPPKQYTETSLVKLLERKGIGRPSTYASIISTLLARDYVGLSKRVFVPTELGEAVAEALTGRFDIMESEYTREMESQLDLIAQGRSTYISVVSHYDKSLDAQLLTFQNANIKAFGNEKTEPCPECEDGILRRMKGKYGYFWGCSNYKNGCQCMRPDENGSVGEKKEKAPRDTSRKCPNCEKGYLQHRKGKKGNFLGCDSYPKCKHTEKIPMKNQKIG